MYYSVYDRQCGTYLYSGRNSTTRQQAIDEAFEYLTCDWEKEDIKEVSDNKEQVLNISELTIEEHTEKLTED